MTKYIIIGVMPNRDKQYLTDHDGTTSNVWTSDRNEANVYCDYDMALGDWFEVAKRPFKRVFIARVN